MKIRAGGGSFRAAGGSFRAAGCSPLLFLFMGNTTIFGCHFFVAVMVYDRKWTLNQDLFYIVFMCVMLCLPSNDHIINGCLILLEPIHQ